MTYYRLLFCLVLFSLPTALSAQKRDETVVSKGMRIDSVIKKAALGKRAADDFARLEMELEIEVSNNTDKPRLIIGRAVQIVGIRIAQSRDLLTDQKYLDDRSYLPSFKDNAIVKDLTLQSSDVQVVYPGGVVRQKVNYWMWMPDIVPAPLLKSIWVELDVSFFPMNTMAAEADALQKAWVDSGQLFLETITTGPSEVRISLN
jgi:hypothetical protein